MKEDSPYKTYIVQMLVNLCLMGIILFSVAGTFCWWRAWVILGISLVCSSLMLFGLRKNEAVLRERVNISPIQPGQPLSDRIILVLFFLFYLALLFLIPLDQFHWHLMSEPSLIVSSGGLLLYLLGSGLVYLALKENPFAAPVVRHLKEKEQHVVSTGIYSVVRHPMYAGIILFLIGIPLWLESYYAAFFSLILVGLLVFRIQFEEEFLQAKLPGYRDYMEQVPYRLIPYIW